MLNEVRTDLAAGLDPIEFNMSKWNFYRLLKGLGYRFERIKNRPQIYERSDLAELRAQYLRCELKIKKNIKHTLEKYGIIDQLEPKSSSWMKLGCLKECPSRMIG